MRKKFMKLGLVIVFSGSVVLTPRAALAAAPAQAGVPPTASGRTPLTNADVIRMLQAILGRIRLGPVNFDLSPMGVAALRQAGVAEPILNAMGQAERQAQANAKPPVSGGVASPPVRPGFVPGQPANRVAGPVRVVPGTAVTLSPQPYPPGPGGRLHKSQSMSPTAVEGNGSTGMLNAGTRAGSHGGNGGAVANAQNSFNSANFAGPAIAIPALIEARKDATGPGLLAQRVGTAAPALSPTFQRLSSDIAAQCARNPAFQILVVTAVPATGRTRTLAAGQQYTIWGCSFGASAPNNAVIFDTYSGRFPLRINGWGNESIQITVPAFASQSVPGSLVVKRADGQANGKNGFQYQLGARRALPPNRVAGPVRVAPGAAVELSPQPYPPSASPGTLRAKARVMPRAMPKINLGAIKRFPAIVNAAAAQHDAAMIGLLRNQKQAAQAEWAQMKLGIRRVGQAGLAQVPMHTMSGSTGGSFQPAGRTAANARLATARTVSSNSKQGPGNRFKLSPGLAIQENLAVACAQDPTMRIMSVSGMNGAPITFTTDPSGNFYTIVGCSLGNPGPNSKVYLYYQNTFRLDFESQYIQQWNDNAIELSLDPSLTGIGDHDNLTLVVQRADGQQAVKTGFKFYAMRQQRRMMIFPKQYFSPYSFGMNYPSDLQGGISSPVDPTGSFPNNTSEARWGDPDLQPAQRKGWVTAQSTPPSGTDIYDFSHLQPGFEVTDVYLESPDPGAFCSAARGNLVATNGAFSGRWNDSSHLWITWQGWNCYLAGQNCNFWGCTDQFEIPVTDYALHVSVEGPRGVDPWTGKPTGK